MERPERYDPEDLEHLMLERSFDELLAEERAFALRHLKDRNEYERMRELLQMVQGHRQAAPGPSDAGPAVRERVLHAFRIHHRPQWRIWLNGVGAFWLPARPAAYWRTALAMGVVVVVAISVVRLARHEVPTKELAELQPVPAHPTPAALPAVPQQVATTTGRGDATADSAQIASHQPASDHADVMASRSAAAAPMQRQSAHAQGIPPARIAARVTMDSVRVQAAAPPLARWDAYGTPALSEQLAEEETGKDIMAVVDDKTSKRERQATAGMGTTYGKASTYTVDDLLGLLQATW